MKLLFYYTVRSSLGQWCHYFPIAVEKRSSVPKIPVPESSLSRSVHRRLPVICRMISVRYHSGYTRHVMIIQSETAGSRSWSRINPFGIEIFWIRNFFVMFAMQNNRIKYTNVVCSRGKSKPPLFDTTFVYLDTCSIVLRLNSGGFFYINLKNERSHEFKNTLLQSYNPVPI